jgi:hypothetical protein
MEWSMMENSPVSMVWNAVSTLVESRAEVSRNETPFFSANQKRKKLN